ncbi:hypothetical protein PYW08_009927 [Mythimna loreyi]|uniref:Uncharacterized protein n=1 Tax=Mythimna loreyi TaxID=667449 RepID=A0ACC2Q8P0_9NEOP|nr:hypothetical protein PYW08_009927 [Mythimna loreyi]
MTGHWLFFKLMIVLNVGPLSAERCDRASTVLDREGSLGQSGAFPWLGVLHVELRELIATSGVVLINYKHALVNADDVARIPQHIFKSNCRIMFLAARNNSIYVKPASYITHPEYEFTTVNSIAIIQLDLRDGDNFSLTPVCLATAKSFRASRYLHLTGFTHDNEVLEKVIYKIQYLNKKVCDEFYNKTEFSTQKPIPSDYLCGYAPYSSSHCVWDNGMALVSNELGYLYLIGFSIHGPGCAAPARFIDLFPYLYWINSIIGAVSHRPKLVSNIPIHDLYTKSSRRYWVIGHHYEKYPYEVLNPKFLISRPTTKKESYLISFTNEWGEDEDSCTSPTRQIYRDIVTVRAVDKLRGFARYKLSLFDLHQSKCVCVRLTVNCDERSDAILAFKEEINFKEDIELFGTAGDGTPEEIFRYFPNETHKKGGEILSPQFINDHDVLSRKVDNYELYITFNFTGWGKLEFEMLAAKEIYIPETLELANEIIAIISQDKKIRRAKTKVKAKSRKQKAKTEVKSLWGLDDWADNMLAEDKLDIETVVKVHELQNAAPGEPAAQITVVVNMVGWLLAVTLRRML